MPRAPSDFYLSQKTRFDSLKKKNLSVEERNELVTLPRPGDKTGRIRKYINSHGFVGKELPWAKNPRTGALVLIPHEKKVSRVGLSIKTRTLSNYAKKYTMIVHVHPKDAKGKIYAGPSDADVSTFMKSGFRSSSIVILDEKGMAVGNVMLKKTNIYLNASDTEKRRFQNNLQKRIRELLYWDVNRNFGSYEFRRQIALNMALSEGKLSRYGFGMRVSLDKGYKTISGEHHSIVVDAK